jgi:hypothetical protein
MNDMALDLVSHQPSRQPEPVPAGLEGNGNTCDAATASRCLVTPALQQAQQGHSVRHNLLQGLSFDSRHRPGNEPT